VDSKVSIGQLAHHMTPFVLVTQLSPNYMADDSATETSNRAKSRV
jgi:hypothetical protein